MTPAGILPAVPVRKSVDEMLAEVRAGLARIGPAQAREEMGEGALVIDIRTAAQRAADGIVPETIWIERNVLEWRCDPSSDARDERVGGLDRRVIVMCDEGYASSLAAAALQTLGFAGATDLAGGYQAWRAEGLPIEP